MNHHNGLIIYNVRKSDKNSKKLQYFASFHCSSKTRAIPTLFRRKILKRVIFLMISPSEPRRFGLATMATWQLKMNEQKTIFCGKVTFWHIFLPDTFNPTPDSESSFNFDPRKLYRMVAELFLASQQQFAQNIAFSPERWKEKDVKNVMPRTAPNTCLRHLKFSGHDYLGVGTIWPQNGQNRRGSM
jgi:hypothetical protein